MINKDDFLTCEASSPVALPRESLTIDATHGIEDYHLNPIRSTKTGTTGKLSAAEIENDPFIIRKFDGPDDPYNPRRRSKLYKWAIVIIISSSSLCV
jgi:hypothetical protein